VSAGSRNTATGGSFKTSQHPCSQHLSKCKAKELTSLGNSIEPANSSPEYDAGSAPLPAFSSATGELTAVGSLQLEPPKFDIRGCTGWTCRPLQPSGLLKPTAIDSDMSDCGVSSETTNRRMSSEMSGPLSDKPDGTTYHMQVDNTCLPADRPN